MGLLMSVVIDERQAGAGERRRVVGVNIGRRDCLCVPLPLLATSP